MGDDNDKDDPIQVSFHLTDMPLVPFYGDKYPHQSITFDWAPIAPSPVIDGPDYRWVTAVQKVSPTSSAFWYDYAKRNNEKVILKISGEKDPQGRRCCDVMLFSRRTVGDVVLSAWNEYNEWNKSR